MISRTDRACMICGIILPFQEFSQNGCPNCESLLNIAGSDLVSDVTSQSYEGIVALGEPSESWVARWLRIDGFQPGVYAVKVNGKLPDDLVKELKSKGVFYRPRDGSVNE